MSINVSIYHHCPCPSGATIHTTFSQGITGNLAPMARAAGLYDCIWGAHEKTGSELIESLRAGVHKLKLERTELAMFNPPNGWGNIDVLEELAQGMLNAILDYPESKVDVG